jgi:hypothetical protein
MCAHHIHTCALNPCHSKCMSWLLLTPAHTWATECGRMTQCLMEKKANASEAKKKKKKEEEEEEKKKRGREARKHTQNPGKKNPANGKLCWCGKCEENGGSEAEAYTQKELLMEQKACTVMCVRVFCACVAVQMGDTLRRCVCHAKWRHFQGCVAGCGEEEEEGGGSVASVLDGRLSAEAWASRGFGMLACGAASYFWMPPTLARVSCVPLFFFLFFFLFFLAACGGCECWWRVWLS